MGMMEHFLLKMGFRRQNNIFFNHDSAYEGFYITTDNKQIIIRKKKDKWEFKTIGEAERFLLTHHSQPITAPSHSHQFQRLKFI